MAAATTSSRETYASPSGFDGYFAGWRMAFSPAQRSINQWTLSLANVRPQDRILEIGCGPGQLVKACAKKLTTGCVIGIDHSWTMARQAHRRNAAFINRGLVRIVHTNIANVASQYGSFDKVFMVDVVQYVPDLAEAYQVGFKVLAPGGIMTTSFSLRLLSKKGDDGLQLSHLIQRAMSKAGFTHITSAQQRASGQIKAISITGKRPTRDEERQEWIATKK